MLARTRGILDRFLDLLLPAHCHQCGGPARHPELPYFCVSCWEAIPRFTGTRCAGCGIPLSPPAAEPARCGACLTQTLPFDRALAAAPYRGTVQTAIHLFKYQGKHGLAEPLARLLVPLLQEAPAVDLLVPVPLHPRRLRQRGFNQAALLAYRLGRRTGLPFHPDALTRVRWTPPQVTLERETRLRNLRGAFALAVPEAVAERRVGLVDDVYTTGATVRECARVLKQGGARTVTVLTLALSEPGGA